MRRLLQILFWSIIAAAFIGPGTVTTAAASGTRYGFSLLWALLFSTIACLVLQEASARTTVVSKHTLAQAIRKQFSSSRWGLVVVLMVLGTIVLGCAAYEAGNILGSVAGVGLKIRFSPKLLTLIIGVASALLLYFGTTKTVARFLGILVALMGVVFLAIAFLIKPPLGALAKGIYLPTFPDGSGLLLLGLIGTTVVPYNLFLGSGIAAGQKLGELRFGLSIAILFGGIISMGILVVGTAVTGSFSFQALSGALSQRIGDWASVFFAVGLFAAGLSSAITAPLAAAITARGLLDSREDGKWHERSKRYRAVWLGVLFTGIFFGLIEVRPIPAIILAQALNGVLLPFVAIFLFFVVNDRELMGERGINELFPNLLMGVVVAVTIVIGLSKSMQAVTSVFGLPKLGEHTLFIISVAVTAILTVPIVLVARNKRR